MDQEKNFSYSHTADYSYIEAALKARWQPYEQLCVEFDNFIPREISDFSEERASELVRLKAFNPTSTEEQLLKFIDNQIFHRTLLPIQLHLEFGDRVMAEYVTVAFLSHALCESVINAILAIGLSMANTPELFEIHERSDIKEKWCIGPKAFQSTYTLSKDGTLYQTLRYLTRQRNALVHYKIDLEMRGKPVLRGSRLERASLKEHLDWIRRFFSLPYDLVDHARRFIPQSPEVLYNSDPIKRVPNT